MQMPKFNLLELLDYIDPAQLTYQEWIDVGFALKEEGYTASDWDNWSKQDGARYRPGECFRKWDSFEGTGITGATITQLAKENGWKSRGNKVDHELDWDDEIEADNDYVVIDKNWVEGMEIQEPKHWDPVRELTTYLETIFDSSDNVGYVTSTWENDEGMFFPTKGNWDRTAGQLIQELGQADGDLGAVFGDYNSDAGAWIRFNPLDGEGIKNENVTEFRYALVESDSMDLEKQNAILRELELPIAALVYSGKKSIHGIVKIDAGSYEEYRKRVDYLYDVCRRNGLDIDNQNRNPSRLSRMPGIERNGKKQFIIDTHIGKESWDEWHEWIEDINDDLPDMENLTDSWNDMPDLSPPLIEGVLRQGHKMLMAGPSKAGKSFALIGLSIAIAEGERWMGWNCTKGKVLYVNLELDRASALHRFKDVYKALDLEPDNVDNIDVWNLRGHSVPMDKLAPKLIRRAQKNDYIAVIIDPIYKVLTGDENSADQMAHFTNQFDKVCTELDSSVIYCHHHSKGSQGDKSSMDRASGSGVFARDPDALIDLIELEVTESLIKQEQDKAACSVYAKALEESNPNYFDEHVGPDDLLSVKQMTDHVKRALPNLIKVIEQEVEQATKHVKTRSAWRVEGTLREYPRFDPVNMWFSYPIHIVDEVDSLKDLNPESEKPQWQKNQRKKKTPAERKEERKKALETAYEACTIDEIVTLEAMSEFMGVTERTVRNRINSHGGFDIENGEVTRKNKE